MSHTSHHVIHQATVVITGAARGMGELFARRAVHDGARAVALWDVDSARVSTLAQELNSPECTVRAYGVDVSDRDAIAATAQHTRNDLGDATILINNAGIARGGPFAQQDAARDIQPTVDINVLAPMLITREFLPTMVADRRSKHRILNMASAAGTLANPNMSVYAASKWALIGWGESLRLELTRSGSAHVAVTTFCPSFVSTGMFEHARPPILTPVLTPDQAVNIAWAGMIEGRPLITQPWSVKLGMALRGVLPTRAWDVVADKVFRVYSSMDHYKDTTTH